MTTASSQDRARSQRHRLKAAARRVLQVADVLVSGDASIADVLRPGFSLTSARMVARIRAHVPALQTILDAGANVGQFTLAAARAYPDARVLAFEPVPNAAAILRRRSSGNPHIEVHECALGRENGELTLFQNEYSHVSSALSIHPKNPHPNYDPTKVQALQVKVARLDDCVLANDLAAPALLKLDVQGYEREVLAGAHGILSGIEYVVVEAAFVELYQDQPMFEDLHGLLCESGYELVAPVGVQEGSAGVVIEMDGLYRRRPT